MRPLAHPLLTALIVASGGAASAQTSRPSGQAAAAPTTPTSPSVTYAKVTLGGTSIPYKAEAGTLRLTNHEGKELADVFYVAYTKSPADKTRPVTFAFNGGPGSSSVWLHLGALGPQRIKLGAEGEPPPPPHRVSPNPSSWLDLTDLVFIDPVSTGFSRAVKGESPKQFHGLKEDLASVGEFIRRWTVANDRWGAPKYLAGESYGTTRAAGLANLLQEKHGMYLNGLVLISAVLNFQTIRFGAGNDLPHWLFLPTYAATAWFHKRLPPDLQKQDLDVVLKQVERFAETDYLTALAQGDLLSPTRRTAIASSLARFTGLSPAYVLRADLRLTIWGFVKELLRKDGRTVGRLDSRYKGIDGDHNGSRAEYDPSYAAILGPYSGALKDYLPRVLKYREQKPYEILTGRVRPWKYPARNGYVNVATDLRRAMTRNKALKVLVCSGRYDLATPYFATDYTLAHMKLAPSLRKNVRVATFRSGHMMYVREADLVKLKQEVARFYPR